MHYGHNSVSISIRPPLYTAKWSTPAEKKRRRRKKNGNGSFGSHLARPMNPAVHRLSFQRPKLPADTKLRCPFGAARLRKSPSPHQPPPPSPPVPASNGGSVSNGVLPQKFFARMISAPMESDAGRRREKDCGPGGSRETTTILVSLVSMASRRGSDRPSTRPNARINAAPSAVSRPWPEEGGESGSRTKMSTGPSWRRLFGLQRLLWHLD